MELEKEDWKEIEGLNGYFISSLGRVKSKNGILSQSVNEKGYFYIKVGSKPNRRKLIIHQLVAIAFIDKNYKAKKLVVNHLNEIKTDNRLSNLEVTTSRKNTIYSIKSKTSNYTGVYWQSKAKKWHSKLHIGKKTIYLGIYKCELKAAYIYNMKLKQLT